MATEKSITELLEETEHATPRVPQTIVVDEAELARQQRFRKKLMALRGKIKFDIDVDELRGRRR